jgi:acetyl/propionyl-CoA carboxylase alpha subunit
LDKFFYTNDISVLLDVTIRELWNLTDEHTHVQKGYLLLLEKLIQYTINYNIPYRYHDIAELLYVISQRSKNTCYSNEIQHAKLVALSNIAQRIMNSFNSILKVSTITPVSSNENLHSLNTKDSSISLSSSNLKKKEKSKKNKSSKIQSKSDISITSLTPISIDMENENDNHFEQKKENKRRINPLNKINIKIEDEDNNELIKEKEEENSNKKKDDIIIDKDHEDLSHKALDSFMKSNQQYHENNQVIQTIQSEPPAIEESPLSPVEEYRDHDKLSQKSYKYLYKILPTI